MTHDSPIADKATRMVFLKSVALALIFCLFIQEFSYAYPEVVKADVGRRLEERGKRKEDIAWAKKILPQIPESVATIEDAYKVPESKETIILVQDAHTNTSCQSNASKLFDILFSDKGQATGDKSARPILFTEAAKGNVNLTFLREKASLSQRKQIADEYLHKGLLHGIEYLDLTSEHDFRVEGVEEPSLYFEALEVYKQSAKKRDSFERYLQEIESTIQTLAPRILNPFLLSFLEKVKNEKSGKTNLTDYVDTLFFQASTLSINLKDYPQLQKLKHLKTLESKIDFQKANQEQQKAIESLKPEDRKDLMDSVSPSKLSAKDLQRGFVLSLNEKIKDKTLYPELAKYLRYFEKSKSLNPKEIVTQKKNLEERIFKALSVNEEESKLLVSIKTLEFYKKLFSLSLTPEEYEEFKKEDFTDLKTLSGFLNKQLMNLKSDYDKALFLNEDFSDMAALCRRFYELTYDRDKAFLSNMLEVMRRQADDSDDRLSARGGWRRTGRPIFFREELHEKTMGLAGDRTRLAQSDETVTSPRPAVLITGGFHTPNLKYLLKKNNISYISIVPGVLHETNVKRYEEILLSQSIGTKKILSNSIISAASGLDTGYYAVNGVDKSPEFTQLTKGFFKRFGADSDYSVRAARMAAVTESQMVRDQSEKEAKALQKTDIEAALESTKGNVKATSRLLSRSRVAVYNAMRQYQIDPKTYRPPKQTSKRTPGKPGLQKTEVESALESTGGNVTKTAAILHTSRRGLYQAIKRYGTDPNIYRQGMQVSYITVKLPTADAKISSKLGIGEYQLITDALQRANNNKTRAAKILGISRVALYKAMKRCGIDLDDPVPSQPIGSVIQTWPERLENILRHAIRKAKGRRRKAASMMGISREMFYRHLKSYGIDPAYPEARGKAPQTLNLCLAKVNAVSEALRIFTPTNTGLIAAILKMRTPDVINAIFDIQANRKKINEWVRRFLPLMKLVSAKHARKTGDDPDYYLSGALVGLEEIADRYPMDHPNIEGLVATAVNRRIIDQIRKEGEWTRSEVGTYKKLRAAEERLLTKGIANPTTEELARESGESVDRILHDRVISGQRQISQMEPKDGTRSQFDRTVGNDDPVPQDEEIDALRQRIQAIGELSEQEKYVLLRKYVDPDRATEKQIAREINLSESRISQLHQSALEKLRNNPDFFQGIHRRKNGSRMSGDLRRMADAGRRKRNQNPGNRTAFSAFSPLSSASIDGARMAPQNHSKETGARQTTDELIRALWLEAGEAIKDPASAEAQAVYRSVAELAEVDPDNLSMENQIRYATVLLYGQLDPAAAVSLLVRLLRRHPELRQDDWRSVYAAVLRLYFTARHCDQQSVNEALLAERNVFKYYLNSEPVKLFRDKRNNQLIRGVVVKETVKILKLAQQHLDEAIRQDLKDRAHFWYDKGKSLHTAVEHAFDYVPSAKEGIVLLRRAFETTYQAYARQHTARDSSVRELDGRPSTDISQYGARMAGVREAYVQQVLSEEFRLDASFRLVDIGCGRVPYLAEQIAGIYYGADVEAMDVYPEDEVQARGVRYRKATFESTGFEDESFDVADSGLTVAESIDGKFLASTLETFLAQRAAVPAADEARRTILRHEGAGRHLIAYSADDFDLVLKMTKDLKDLGWIKSSWLGHGYALVKERLNWDNPLVSCDSPLVSVAALPDARMAGEKIITQGLPIEQRDELVFAIHVYDATKKAGHFAVTARLDGAPDILEVQLNEATTALIVRFNDRTSVEIKNYKAVLQRNRNTQRLEKGTLSLSRNELILALADLKFELTRQTEGIKANSINFVTPSPKVLKLDLRGFMNDNTRATDSLFVDWLIRSMHKARQTGALLVLENGTDFQMADILDRAANLYPRERFIFPNTQTLPESHKNADSVTIVAVDPQTAPVLKKNNLYVIAQALDKNNMHNVPALIQTAITEAEIGLPGINDARNLERLRNIYQVFGIQVQPQEISEFAEFLQGVGLTPDRIERWAIVPFKAGDILRAYALAARMAEQAA